MAFFMLLDHGWHPSGIGDDLFSSEVPQCVVAADNVPTDLAVQGVESEPVALAAAASRWMLQGCAGEVLAVTL